MNLGGIRAKVIFEDFRGGGQGKKSYANALIGTYFF